MQDHATRKWTCRNSTYGDLTQIARQRIAVLTVAIIGAASNLQAQSLDRFYPPAAGVGSESTIAAEGKLPKWPCKIVCDRDDVKLECQETAGQLNVSVPPDAAPGVAWVRLHDDKVATNLCPLIIESAKVVSEVKDENNSVDTATQVDLPAVVTGRLAKRDDVDGYRVTLKSGRTFIASVIANQILQSPIDAVLQLADLHGNVLAQTDDVRGLDPQLLYQPAEDGDAIVRIFAFPSTPNSTIGFSGATNHVYVLRMTDGPFLDHVVPPLVGADVDESAAVGWNLPSNTPIKQQVATQISPAVWCLNSGVGWHLQPGIAGDVTNIVESPDPAAHAAAEKLPVVFSGRITQAKQVDRLRFSVGKGKKYTARSYAKSSGLLLDAVLRVIDVKSGNEVARKDDISRTDFDASVDFKAKEDGQYELQVSDAVQSHGPRHSYSVVLEEARPKVSLTVAADHFTCEAGKTVEIPITVTRLNGFADTVQVSVAGLPSGVTATETTSQPKGDTAKSVKLKLSAPENVAFQGNIQIIGTGLDGDGKPNGQQQSATFALRPLMPLENLWLSIGK